MKLEEKVWEYVKVNMPVTLETGTKYIYEHIEHIDKLSTPDGGFVYEVLLATIRKTADGAHLTNVATYLVENEHGLLLEAKRERVFYVGMDNDPK